MLGVARGDVSFCHFDLLPHYPLGSLVQVCLDTFLGNCPQDLDLSAVYVFLDACPDEHMQRGNKTFQALVELMKLQVR